MGVTIRILTGARAGQTVVLDEPNLIRLGRRPGNDVQFDVQRDLDVSGNHAEIRREGDTLYLYDIGSANGVFCGDAKIEKIRLTHGQQFSLGAHGPLVQVGVETSSDERATEGQGVSPVAGHAGPSGEGAPIETAADALERRKVASSLGERKIGAKTVAMMIDRAVGVAQAQDTKGRVGKSTVFLRAMVSQAVTQSTRRFKILAIVLVVLLVGTIGAFLFLRNYEQSKTAQSDRKLRKQMAALMTALHQKTGLSPDRRKAIVDQLRNVRARVGSTHPVAAGKAIVIANRNAIFLVAVHMKGGDKGFCTAFAVRKRVLATNAHCVVAIQRFSRSRHKSYVVMNRQPGKRYVVSRAVRHPRYHKPLRSISEDVGLLFVTRDLPAWVTFASTAELRSLESGDVMYTYGFPGRLAPVRSPNATLSQGIVGRVTKLNGDTGSFKENKLIQHSAFTSGGTSGSPIFDASGKVIAVNAGGYVESGTLRVMDPSSGRSRALRVAKQLSGYNFGIRVDVLRAFLAKF